MKYLSDYTESKQTQLFQETGTFFAFSNAQFDEQKKDGIEYTSLGAGMICPKENAKTVLLGLQQIHKEGIKQDLEENGKEQIIIRELHNHECFISWDCDEVVDRLKAYEITEDEIWKVFKEESQRVDA
ncbi:MAG: hypothetical protein AAF391_07575 [Bacteroidota bacterium]